MALWRPTTVVVDVRDEEGGALCASGQLTPVLGPYMLYDRPTKTFTLYNASALTLSGAVVQINPDRHGIERDWVPANPNNLNTQQIGPNPSLWQTYDSTTFGTLPGGQVRSVVANDLFRWWRIVALNDRSTAIAVSGWMNAATV